MRADRKRSAVLIRSHARRNETVRIFESPDTSVALRTWLKNL
jgi:hypothetical protein